VAEGGEIVAVVRSPGCAQPPGAPAEEYPDRTGLARVYRLLRTAEGHISRQNAADRLEKVGLLGALPAAMGIFSELGLWRVEGEAIFYLPEPERKLDLEQAVLYNKITRYAIRLQCTLSVFGKGILQDGLERKIRVIPDFPQPGISSKTYPPAQGWEALRETVKRLAEHFKGIEVDMIVGVESRGFILGAL